ncbi:hypothetical protein B0H16DRAFT_1220310, partial [Mycena metata]
NSFGLFREYPSIPTYNPDEMLSPEELADIPGGTRANTATLPSQLTPFEPPNQSSLPVPEPSSPSVSTGPFKNWSIMALMNWQWTGSQTRSIEQMDKLVGVLKDPRFAKHFDIKWETDKFDEYLATGGGSEVRDGWKSASVDISVPDGLRYNSVEAAPVFSVPGLFYRPLIKVIKSGIQNVGDRCFHYTPFKQFWSPSPDGPPQRLYDEIYASDAMVEAHTAVQKLPPEPNCMLKRVVLALMFWSDSTHLASFGDASLWPLYLFFGNQSKWLRVKPQSNTCHHIAYFPKV